jgi:hypothetical protein
MRFGLSDLWHGASGAKSKEVMKMKMQGWIVIAVVIALALTVALALALPALSQPGAPGGAPGMPGMGGPMGMPPAATMVIAEKGVYVMM